MEEEAVQTIDFGVPELTTEELEENAYMIIDYLAEEGKEIDEDDVDDKADELIEAMDRWTTQWILDPGNGLVSGDCDVDDLETDDEGVHWFRATASESSDVPLQDILMVLEDSRMTSGLCEVAVRVFGSCDDYEEDEEEDYDDEEEAEDDYEDGEY